MLKDPDYYDIDVKVLAEEYSNLSMYTDLTILFFRPFLGLILDINGRKWPIVLSMIASGIYCVLLPNLKNLYPGLYLTKVGEHLFLMLSMEAPLIPDYVDKDSIGLASSYTEVVMHIGTIVGGSLMLAIVVYFPSYSMMFYMWGVINVLTAILLFFIV